MNMPEDQTKKKVREIDATPESRNIFNSLARGGYSLPGAVEEYIDNAIDQASHQNTHDREIKVKTSAVSQQNPVCSIEIEDDCGGCKIDDAVRFIKPGMSGNVPAAGNISTFGIGGKAAGLAVSSKVKVTSRFPGENEWRVILDKLEISNKKDWKFQVEEIEGSDFEEGHTVVTLYLEPDKVRDFTNFGYDIQKSIKKRYSAFLAKKVRLYLNDVRVETGNPYGEILSSPFAPQGCEPIEVQKNFRIPYMSLMSNGGVTEISIKTTVGLHWEASNTQEFGTNIYCNGRLLIEHDKTGLNNAKGAPGTDVVWLRSTVEITGLPEAMPWNNRKDALDHSSPAFSKLEEFLSNTYEKYLNNLAEAKQGFKDRTGKRSSYGGKDLIAENFANLIKMHNNDSVFFPDYLKKTQAFRDAEELSKKDKHRGRSGDPSITHLAADVETDKVERIRRKIRELSFEDNVKNVDIVRELVDHYLRCVVTPRKSENGTNEA